MSPELETLIEFLTGSKMTPDAVPWWLLRAEDVRVIRSWAGEALPAASQLALMKALRTVLATCTPEEEVASERTPVSVVVRRGTRRLVSRGLGPREARRLLEMSRTAEDATALRDAAIVSLMLLAGLRRAEIVGLQVGDYDEDDGRLVVHSGRRGLRSVILMGECRGDLEAWIEARGGFSGPLFVRFNCKGSMIATGLSTSSVNRVLNRRCREAGGLVATPSELRGRFLWQLQLAGRRDERPPCRYYQDENGVPAWTLSSLAAV
ncbi:MAG TPA: tyrosine-type recombinase/integrase [Dehalococcoidia bacterium]|nr:tyrosine-type recombinase/integrase [Dehalococcoidia bacterium]